MRGCVCSRHPAFPAPSMIEGHCLTKLGRIAPRECGVVSLQPPSLRGAKRRSYPFFLCAPLWIASRSLSSGARSRDPLTRNDGLRIGCLKIESISVVPDKRARRARSGTHNHQCSLLRQAGATAKRVDTHQWLWVLAFARTTSISSPPRAALRSTAASRRRRPSARRRRSLAHIRSPTDKARPHPNRSRRLRRPRPCRGRGPSR